MRHHHMLGQLLTRLKTTNTSDTPWVVSSGRNGHRQRPAFTGLRGGCVQVTPSGADTSPPAHPRHAPTDRAKSVAKRRLASRNPWISVGRMDFLPDFQGFPSFPVACQEIRSGFPMEQKWSVGKSEKDKRQCAAPLSYVNFGLTLATLIRSGPALNAWPGLGCFSDGYCPQS